MILLSPYVSFGYLVPWYDGFPSSESKTVTDIFQYLLLYSKLAFCTSDSCKAFTTTREAKISHATREFEHLKKLDLRHATIPG